MKYFRQRLLSLVNLGLRAAIIRLSPLIHEGEQRSVASLTPPPPPLKNPGYAPDLTDLPGRGKSVDLKQITKQTTRKNTLFTYRG